MVPAASWFAKLPPIYAPLRQVEEFEDKQKELESVIQPIMTKMYQQGGGGAESGMPGGGDFGGSADAGGGAGGGGGGPTVEEVD